MGIANEVLAATPGRILNLIFMQYNGLTWKIR